MAVVLRRKKENGTDGGQVFIHLFILCCGYVFNILKKDLYLLLEERKNVISLTEQFKYSAKPILQICVTKATVLSMPPVLDYSS